VSATPVGTSDTISQNRQGIAPARPVVEIVGPSPFARDAAGLQPTRIGTVFPVHRALVTLPGIHATQRVDFIERCNEQRRAAGRPPPARNPASRNSETG